MSRQQSVSCVNPPHAHFAGKHDGDASTKALIAILINLISLPHTGALLQTHEMMQQQLHSQQPSL